MNEKMTLTMVTEELQARGYDAAYMEINKTNVVKPSICIRRNNVGVNFYAGTFKNLDAPITTLADEVEEQLDEFFDSAPDTSKLCDPEYVRTHLTVRLCNESWNQERLAEAVKARVFDTDLIQYLMLTVELPNRGTGACVVTKKVLEAAGISEAEAWNCAYRYLDAQVKDMRIIMAEMMGLSVEEIPPMAMAVISNSDKCYGSTAILSREALEQAATLLGTDSIYLIPSSVHECIAVPAGISEESILTNMICEVNGDVVNQDEWLSDHPYIWDGTRLRSAGVQKEGAL